MVFEHSYSGGTDARLRHGADGIYDRVEHKYNRQGEVKETKDQNGTVHAFDLDKLGRSTFDRVPSVRTELCGHGGPAGRRRAVSG